MKKGLFFLLFGLICTPAMADVKAYFSPSLDCEKQIVSLINGAQEDIQIAIYTITNRSIIRAIEKAHQRGVNVRIVTDFKQADSDYSAATRLYQKGIPIKINTEFEIEHNKFGVFDGMKMVTGSYNWTFSASTKNSENCLVISEEPDLIAQYQKRFETLWKTYDASKSRRFFESKMH